MKFSTLSTMKNGWFVGAFTPTAFSTDACEVAVKSYKAGDSEDAHYHRVATEITLILSGHVCIAGVERRDGDIILLEPSEIADFYAITDAVTVVVKVPGKLGDKFSARTGRPA